MPDNKANDHEHMQEIPNINTGLSPITEVMHPALLSAYAV